MNRSENKNVRIFQLKSFARLQVVKRFE